MEADGTGIRLGPRHPPSSCSLQALMTASHKPSMVLGAFAWGFISSPNHLLDKNPSDTHFTDEKAEVWFTFLLQGHTAGSLN